MSQKPNAPFEGPTVRELVEMRTMADSKPGARSDPYRLALVIEGGGMRGVISAGMATAIAEAGLTDCLDDVFGASAGAINAAWLLSPDPHVLWNWTDPSWATLLIRRRNLLRGKPLVDVAHLIDRVYVDDVPLDYPALLASPIGFHPVATNCLTGESEDLHRFLVDVEGLTRALKASSALPVLAGGPVSLGGVRYTDAGVSEPVPVPQAVRQGATHVLVLRSRHQGDRRSPDPSGARRVIMTRALLATGHGELVARAVHTRSGRDTAFDQALTDGWRPRADVMTIWPDEQTPRVPRLERRGRQLSDAFEGGRAQVHRALPITSSRSGPCRPRP